MYEILLVDDDRAVRYQLKRLGIWDSCGFHICDEATDGVDALKKIYSQHFDVVFADIKMPGLNGIEFLTELRERQNDICVVIMSSYREFTYARQGIRLGAFDYLLKPVSENDLIPLLKDLKSFLDSRSTDLEYRAKARETLQESLRMPYSSQDEAKMFRILTEEPDSVVPFAREIGKKLCEFYDNDSFKIATILESSCNNVSALLHEKMPWLSPLNAVTRDEIHFHLLDNVAVMVHSYCERLEAYSTLIRKMHLDKPDSVVRRLCEYAICNSASDITLETAGRELGYSAKYLGKAFREKTGEGFPEYITKVKMERAKACLLSGRFKNYEISEILGYKNPDYFCRVFKQYLGMTPSEYKKSFA